ncbi:MAG: BON domain-containing protein [Limisphaerales bacterium]
MTREYKYEGVVVKTFKGTVQLSGFVDTSAQKSKAASIAKGVEGVKELENNITVKD